MNISSGWKYIIIEVQKTEKMKARVLGLFDLAMTIFTSSEKSMFSSDVMSVFAYCCGRPKFYATSTDEY